MDADDNEQRGSSNLSRWAFVLSVFVLPYVIVYGSPLPEATNRIITLFINHILFMVGALWWSLNPRSEVIDESGKIHAVASSATVKKVEFIFRFVGLCLGLFFLWQTMLLLADVKDIAVGQPYFRVSGEITDNSTAFPSVLIRKTLSVRKDGVGSNIELNFYYCLERFRIGERVTFIVLPRTRAIIKQVL